jgi:hypothetical protein
MVFNGVDPALHRFQIAIGGLPWLLATVQKT